MDKEKTINICKEFFSKDSFNTGISMTMTRLFISIFDVIPDKYSLAYNGENGAPVIGKNSYTDGKKYPVKSQIIGVNTNELVTNICKDDNLLSIAYVANEYSVYTLTIGEGFIFPNGYKITQEDCDLNFPSVYATKEGLNNFMKYFPSFVKDTERYYHYVTIGSSGDFTTTPFAIKENADTSLDNYNDDCPYDKLLEFCNKEGCGLSLLYGLPGTGKTTLIKKLITNSKSTFYLLDASLLGNIVSASFVDFLMDECKNTVFILEDCEKLLLDRNITNNPWIGTILNLTDGMLGDGLNIRFICTFNASVESIDPALKRKGRLKISYEFKPLTKEKVEKLGKEIDKDIHGEMTLAEIYGEDYEVSGKLTTNRKKIGF